MWSFRKRAAPPIAWLGGVGGSAGATAPTPAERGMSSR